MGIFEKVMQERHPVSESVTLTPREAFAAIVVGAFNADGRVPPEEAVRVNEIFNSTKVVPTAIARTCEGRSGSSHRALWHARCRGYRGARGEGTAA